MSKEFTECPTCDPEADVCVCPQRTKPPGTDSVDDWVWQITKTGENAYRHWLKEQELRDQDANNVFIYSGFNGEGIIEVMENQVRASEERFGILPWSKVLGVARKSSW